MSNTSLVPANPPPSPTRLRAIVDRLQSATTGSRELDALIQQALPTLPACLGGPGTRVPSRSARWSSELSAAMSLLSADFNFSVGQRDGICWAWIQPNDSWQPGEFESRHDHPAGSGLVVAYTAALALTSATFILGATRLEQQAAA